MSAPIPPMNPQWAMGWERANGRAPSQGDWESFINRQRNGGVEEPTTASQVGQYAGPVGSVAGMAAASYIPSLFSSGAAATAGTTAAGAGATGAGIAGTTAATTGATAAGTTAAAAPVAGTGIYGAASAAAPVAVPVAAALIAAYNTNKAYEASKGKSVGEMFSDEIKKPRTWISPGSLLGGIYGSVFGGRRTRQEEQRWNELGEQGFALPDWVANNENIGEKGAGSRPDLAADFIGLAPTAGDATGIGASPAGSWVNNKFAESRDVADLTAKDIWGYAALPELFGKDYVTTSEANREAIAAKALELGLVSEGKGTIDIKDDPALREYWTSLITPKSENQQIADTVKDTVRRLYNK